MFYALGNIFTPKPRQAESTDTRQAIQRHDPDFEDRNGEGEETRDEDFQQDNATVSVDALRLFLENFVKNKTESAQGENNGEAQTAAKHEHEETEPLNYKIQTEMELGSDESAKQKSGEAAQAASVYQNTAQAGAKSTVLLETTDKAEGPPLDLSAADIRTVYALIEDLKILAEARIEYLHIERAASFLDSLVAAVNKAKSSIQV